MDQNARVPPAKGKWSRPTGSVVAQVSMSEECKRRLTETAKAHGLSLSSFVRLATDEYIERHKW